VAVEPLGEMVTRVIAGRAPVTVTCEGARHGRPAAGVAAAHLWTVADLAQFLGVPVNTIYKWRTSGEGPPAYRVGKHLRFDERQVHERLSTRRDPC
jgi:excisionase family DNA binding protein